MIALVIDEDLRLVGQPAKGGRVDDAVAVALERRAHRMLALRMEPPAGLLRLRRIRRERSDHRQTLRRQRQQRPPSVTEPKGMAVPHRLALGLSGTDGAIRFGLELTKSRPAFGQSALLRLPFVSR